MADEQVPQTPPVPASSIQQVPVPLSFLEKLQAPVDTLWKEYRAFLIVFGIIILIVKFRDVIIDLIVGSAKQTVDNTEKKDAQLKSEEKQANDQANQLRQEANTLSDNQAPVTDDWNKK